MTFCMAWKSARSVFIVADSAITSGLPIRETTSSFGELHVNDDVKVAQGALKIVPMGHAAFTFAGTVPLGYAVADGIEKAGGVDGHISRSFQHAIDSIFPIRPGEGLQAILAISDIHGRPHILRFDSSNGPMIERVDRVVRYGSLEPALQDQAEYLALELVGEGRCSEVAILASVMAYLQSLTVHNLLMQQGVGGHFTGAMLTPDGPHWHPDMIFGLYDSTKVGAQLQCVGNLVRGQVACIPSSITRDTRCFGRSFTQEALMNWKKEWLGEVTTFLARGRCQYFVFLDTHSHRVIVIEMAGEQSHELLHLADGEAFMSPQLLNMLSDGMGEMRTSMKFIPYKPA